MRAGKFSFLLVCALVIKLFIIALILAVCFMSQLLRLLPVFRHRYIVGSYSLWPLRFYYFLQSVLKKGSIQSQLAIPERAEPDTVLNRTKSVAAPDCQPKSW